MTTTTRTRSHAALALLVMITLLGASGCRMILHDGKKSPDRWDKKRIDRAKALKHWESYKRERDSNIKGKRWASLVTMHSYSSSWKRLLNGDREFLPLDSLEERQIEAISMAFSRSGELAAAGKWRDLKSMTASAKNMKYADGGSLDTGEIMLKSVRREANERYLKGDKKNWQGAADAFGGVIIKLGDSIDDRLRNALTKQARTYRKKQILEMEQRADGLIKRRDYDPARKSYEQAISYYKAPADKRQAELYKDLMSKEEASRLDRKLAEVTLTQARDLVAQGKALQDKGRHREGLQKHDKAVSLLGSAEIKQARQASATRWITALKGQASKLESRHPGHALLLYAKAASLGDRGAASKRDSISAALKREHVYKVAVSGDGPGPAMSSMGKAKGSYAANIQIVSGGQADATVSVTVAQASENTSTQNKQGSGKYKSGTKQVKNKDYERAVKDVESIERNGLASAQREMKSVQNKIKNLNNNHNCSRGGELAKSCARQRKTLDREQSSAQRKLDYQQKELAKAKARRDKTPRTASEDVFSTHTYTIYQRTRTVSAGYRARVQHADGRAAISKSTTLSASHTDTEHDAQPKIRVARKALRLESTSSLTSKVYAQTGSTTRGVVMESLRSRQSAMLQKGKQTSGSSRLDWFVIYLLMDPSTSDSSVASEILKATDIEGARGLLK